MRQVKTQHISNPGAFKKQLLNWSQQFDEVIWLDSNDYAQKESSYDAVLAVEAFTVFQTDAFDAFNQLKEYQTTTKDWLFGYLSYDLKNDVERLSSKNHDELGFPDLLFFQPKKIFLLKGNVLETHYLNLVDDELEQDLRDIKSTVTSSGVEK
ncbi:MAG: para-aminobenzoate synthetase component 1, partial [Psychroserpens sp.]